MGVQETLLKTLDGVDDKVKNARAHVKSKQNDEGMSELVSAVGTLTRIVRHLVSQSAADAPAPGARGMQP